MRFLFIIPILICLLSATLGPASLGAQEPKVRAAISSKAPHYAGQKLAYVVELLAPGYFASAPVFDVPVTQGMVIIPPLDSPVVSSETMTDVTYTVQRHELSLLAPQSGDHIVPPITVRFQFKRAPLDKDRVPAAVTTPAVTFTTTQPPGTEGLGQVISARELTVVEGWKPDPAPSNVKAGDAFTRTVTYVARDMPGMMFPPFPTARIDGVAIYPKEPVVRDHSDRGDMVGRRSDSVTYLFQKPGQYRLPGARFTWWDLDTRTVRTIELPAHPVLVAPNPALESARPQVGVSPVTQRSTGTKVCMATITVVAALFASSRRAREQIATCARLFRPVHLGPLNPPEQ